MQRPAVGHRSPNRGLTTVCAGIRGGVGGVLFDLKISSVTIELAGFIQV